jgi:hypothetical protein
MGPGPALPAGATALHITTEASHLIPTLACETAALVPARLATVNGDLVLRAVASGETIAVVWPSGWAAWLVDGRAELVGRDGSVFAREGDVLSDLGGGVGSDDLFHVCIIGT